MPTRSIDEEKTMQLQTGDSVSNSERYARAVATSKRIRFDIDRDVIRGRSFDFSRSGS